MKKTVIFEGGVAKVSTLADGSLSLTIHTQELPPDTMVRVFEMKKKPSMVLLSSDDKISKEEIDLIENFTTEYEFTGKTPSQRLRGVLFRVWEQGPQAQGYDFAIWYEAQIERIISKYKDVLE